MFLCVEKSGPDFFSLFPEEEVCEETGRVRRDDENQLLVPSADICNQLPVNGHEV